MKHRAFIHCNKTTIVIRTHCNQWPCNFGHWCAEINWGALVWCKKMSPFCWIKTRWATAAICFHCGAFQFRVINSFWKRIIKRQFTIYQITTTFSGSTFWLNGCFFCRRSSTVQFLPLITTLSAVDKFKSAKTRSLFVADLQAHFS